MSNLLKQKISTILVFAIILTLIPWTKPAVVNAADTYFQFSDFSTDQNAPTEVNSNIIDLKGSFTGVSPGSITFKVEKIINNEAPEKTIGTTSPVISGSTFLFPAVQLFEGLNKITVIGSNTTGNVVEGSAYVNFNNVPVITEIKLSDNRVLQDGTPLVVATATPAIVIKTNNATELSVNGALAFPGGTGTYVSSNLLLQPGLNNLVFVARNATKTYTLTRQVVYYAGVPTAFNLKAGTDSLDSNPTIPPFNKVITGKLVFERPIANEAPPNIWLDIYKDGSSTVTSNVYATVTGSVYDATGYTVYSFETAPVDLVYPDPDPDPAHPTQGKGDGDYVVRVKSGLYNGDQANYGLPFRLRSSGAPYITGIKQLYNPAVTGTTVNSASSTTNFNSGQTVFQTPLWIMMEANNMVSASVYGLEAYVNGAKVVNSDFTFDDFQYGNSHVFRINNLPAGEVRLDFKAGNDTVSKTIQFVPVPAIQLTNVYNGQKFNVEGELAALTLKGKLLNFNINTDLPSLKVTMNGKTANISATGITAANPVFTFADADVLKLVPGPNQIVISGTASGVPITTSLVVYMFSSSEPQITSVFPVPRPSDLTLPALEVDAEKKFIQDKDNLKQYTTKEKFADVIFEASKVGSIFVKVDGKDYASTTNANNVLTSTDFSKLVPINQDSTTRKYKFRVIVKLPESGPTSITIQGVEGTVSISETITITREFPPYEVLSPLLPNEKVINQNFINLSIQAEGASQILVGKAEMVKGTNDIFRYEYKNLKAGSNKIKFTVFQGTQKTNGEIAVTYAADNSVGAQYKTPLASSGKVSAFKGDLQITFQKNTLLRQANPVAGQSVDLFDSQELLVGIADPKDGRTIKAYNAINPVTNTDGRIVNISPNDVATSLLRPTQHFNLASDLYWIDGGYVDGTKATGYTFVQGAQPYSATNAFQDRPGNRWLEPSQRGKITLKYDSDLRNAGAQNISIWRLYNNKWENIGGKVDTGKKTVTANFDGFGYYAVQSVRYSFNDIVGHDYARNSLELMYARGIMKEKNSNEFGVYDNITRGEFAQMMVKMLDIPLDYDNQNMTFDDVIAISIPDAAWDYRYIETAVRKGIIRGKGPRLFLPNEPLTREEAAVMIARATNLLKGKENADKDKLALQKTFTDGSLISYYSVSAVLAVSKAGYITGMPNTTAGTGKVTFRFDPMSNLKRADAAVIAERVMKKAKLL